MTYGIQHLGPVTRKERLLALYERIAPYVTVSLFIIILFLTAMVVSVASQVLGFCILCGITRIMMLQ